MNAEKKFYVYQYLHPVTKNPFYIGKGTGNRCRQHLSINQNRCFNKRLSGTIRDLISDGNPPIIEIIKNDMTNCEALKLESVLIELWGRRGIDSGGILLNISEGGRQPPILRGKDHPCYGRKHTEESKKKISKTLIRRYKDNPELHGFYGKSHTEESKRRISKSKTGHKFTQEQRESMALARTGHSQPESQKRKASLANSREWFLVDPSGNPFIVFNLRQWAKENNLDQGNLVKVSQGKSKFHKGWKCWKLS